MISVPHSSDDGDDDDDDEKQNFTMMS